MNKLKNMNKKKSFWSTLVNEFLGTILITFKYNLYNCVYIIRKSRNI